MMKKLTSLLLAVVFIVSMFSTSVYANDTSITDRSTINFMQTDNEDVYVSDVMSFSEMVSHYAETMGISYQDALQCFPTSGDAYDRAKATYRTISVHLAVTSSYRPHIEFYCETSESGKYWGILSVYSVQLVRSYKDISKQFSGKLDIWLRSPYQIEYVINGDFYNNGTTTSSGGAGLNLGIDEYAGVSFNASVTTTSNHYKYFYEHETPAFQQ